MVRDWKDKQRARMDRQGRYSWIGIVICIAILICILLLITDRHAEALPLQQAAHICHENGLVAVTSYPREVVSCVK